MLFMHEGAGNRSGSTVEVFVTAPDGEIRAIIMQLQRQVADGMCQVEAAVRSRAACSVGNARQVERAPAEILHAGPEHQRNLLTSRLEQLFELGLIAIQRAWFG